MLPLLTPKLPVIPDRRGSQSDSLTKLFDRIQKGEKERRSFRERRATPRVVANLSLEWLEGRDRVVYQTHDISTFGVAIRNGPTPKKGSKLALRIFLSDNPKQPLELMGEVLGAFDELGGARVKFINPPVEAVRRLHRFLK